MSTIFVLGKFLIISVITLKGSSISLTSHSSITQWETCMHGSSPIFEENEASGNKNEKIIKTQKNVLKI